MVSTADFPQADRLAQVGKVAEAIFQGRHSDGEIENFIGLDSDGRQGRYYRQAAVVLGLITNDRNYSALTSIGAAYASITNAALKLDFLAQRLVDTPVFHHALRYILATSPSDTQLRAWFFKFYPGAASTAARRYSTFVAYLSEAKLVQYAKGVYKLSKYFGSVLKVPAAPAVPAVKPLLPSTPPAVPPGSNGVGVVTVDINWQKMERANLIHWKLVDAKSNYLATRGAIPYQNVHIDLYTEMKNEFIIYEMKSVTDNSDNLLSQVRKAVSQLYEYRFIYAKPDARLCIVTNKGVSKENEWLLSYLERDRAIAYEWTDDYVSFDSGPQSKGLTGVFTP